MLVFILLELTAYYLASVNYNQNEKKYIGQKTQEFKIGLNAVTNQFEKLASTVFELRVNRPDVKTLLKQIPEGDVLKNDEIRKALLGLLQNSFIEMNREHIEFLAFFLPDNHAFLRFSDPSLYGDDISDIRSLIQNVNQKQEAASSFEVGLASAGYRCVFPLFDSTRYLGCVELGIGWAGLREELKDIFPYEFRFLINKEQLIKKTPFLKLDYYIFSDLSEEYFYERHALEKMVLDTRHSFVSPRNIVQFNKLSKRTIESDLMDKNTFGVALRINQNDILAHYYPLKGADGSLVAYIVSYGKDSAVLGYRSDFRIIFILSSLGLMFLIILIAYSRESYRIIRLKHDQLLESEKKLTDLNNSKDKFFSIIAHDLRNPFHGLVGLSQVLKEDYKVMDEEKIQKFHRLIYQSAKQGYQLVLNLLEWTRIQTGRITYNPEKVNISRMADENIDLLRNQAEAKQVEIKNKMDRPYYCYADYNMLSTVIRNLLSNAIKFSEKDGTVYIESHYKAGNLEIVVKDEGIGMDEETIDSLFKIESTRSVDGTGGEQGTGLGLILSYEFVERNNGSIQVKSKLGKGSTFIVRLPVA
ncbi:MAG: ATP-binding protein [Bacteroidales bacterium]|nr:ATP-binding protein [Bacteroidales bacterium]